MSRKRIISPSSSENETNDELYNVEKILSKKMKNGKPQYLVKWEDYSEFHNTWEPEASFESCPELLKEFEDEKQGEETRRRSTRISDKSTNAEKNKAKTKAKTTKRIPEKVLGCGDNSDGEFGFVVRYNDGYCELMLKSKAHKLIPDLVIEYYESHIQWHDALIQPKLETQGSA